MINVSELIADPDFCQPNGITIIRRRQTIVNHRPEVATETINVEGIIIALQANSDELGEDYDRNSEVITVLTYDRLKTAGVDKISGFSYLPDIVVYKNANYAVRECQDLYEYGYCRSKATKLEQDVM